MCGTCNGTGYFRHNNGAAYAGCPECGEKNTGSPVKITLGWLCQGCGEEVPPELVTYEEYHDQRYGGCGGKCV